MTIPDPILRAFLERQAEEGRALARASDILDLDCLPGGQHFIATYHCRGLVKDPAGAVREAGAFHVGITFPAGYLRNVNPPEILTLLGPLNTYHPNLTFGGPFICIGHIVPGMQLVDILYQIYEVLSYQRVTPREDNALNREACRWARANQARFPIDPRPLKRRALALEVERL
jgi:ubiquitin-protein ligase